MKEKTVKGCCKDPSRLNKVGGQAVLEGVMMKAGTRTVTTCRKENGELVVTDGEFHSVRNKNRILNIPILRGVINFVEMMILSVKTLAISADALELEGEKPKKEEGKISALTTALMVISVILGVALALGLFLFLPNLVSSLIDAHLLDGRLGAWRAVLEGGIKIAIFLAYLWLTSLMPDIKRTFMYHGAEHKSIACFESGSELTPENAKKYTRFHPRCGTSYMFFMILLGVFAGLFIRLLWTDIALWQYNIIRFTMLPLVMGLGYEVIMLAGKHENIITKALSAPGLWVQRITTKEPTLDMLEVAITSIKCALRDEFPEFKEFYETRGWEKRDEAETEGTETADTEGASERDEAETVDAEGAEESPEPKTTYEGGEVESL